MGYKCYLRGQRKCTRNVPWHSNNYSEQTTENLHIYILKVNIKINFLEKYQSLRSRDTLQ